MGTRPILRCMSAGADYEYDLFDDDEPSLRVALAELTALKRARLTIGVVARGVFWLCLLFILGNAVLQALADGQVVVAVLELAFFPIAVLVYPFAAAPDALAWPLAEGTSLIPALVAMLVAYPVSTFVGGLPPVE